MFCCDEPLSSWLALIGSLDGGEGMGISLRSCTVPTTIWLDDQALRKTEERGL